jgi:hypothetical protein
LGRTLLARLPVKHLCAPSFCLVRVCCLGYSPGRVLPMAVGRLVVHGPRVGCVPPESMVPLTPQRMRRCLSRPSFTLAFCGRACPLVPLRVFSGPRCLLASDRRDWCLFRGPLVVRLAQSSASVNRKFLPSCGCSGKTCPASPRPSCAASVSFLVGACPILWCLLPPSATPRPSRCTRPG